MKEIAQNTDLENIDSINLKQYFSIQEVSSRLDLSPSLLRYWEGEFPMLQPKEPQGKPNVHAQRPGPVGSNQIPT